MNLNYHGSETAPLGNQSKLYCLSSIPFYPFAIASLGTGVVGLIPYLALREPNTEFTGSKDTLLQILDSRSTGIVLMGDPTANGQKTTLDV